MRKAHNSKLKTQNSKLNIAHRATIQNSKFKTQNRLRRQFKTQNSKFKKVAIVGLQRLVLRLATVV